MMVVASKGQQALIAQQIAAMAAEQEFRFGDDIDAVHSHAHNDTHEKKARNKKREVWGFPSCLEARFGRDSFLDESEEFLGFHADLLFLAIDAIGHEAFFLLLVAKNEGIGDFRDDRVTEAIAELFIRLIDFRADVVI